MFKEVTAAVDGCCKVKSMTAVEQVNVDGKVPHEKGRDVALSLGVDNFQASSGSVQ